MTALDPDGPDLRPLTRRELAMLRFSARHALAGTPWHQLRLATWEAFGLGVLHWRQQMTHLIRLPAAEAAEPAEVRRLRQHLQRRTDRRHASHLSATHPSTSRPRSEET